MEELKPGGKDIIVTNSNKIEYIHLMSNYRLNRQVSHVLFKKSYNVKLYKKSMAVYVIFQMLVK